MEKFDLSGCSIIIPLQVDSKERLEHFRFQESFFPQYFKNYSLIVVEYGEEQRLAPSNFDYLFIKGEDFFSSSHVSNKGAERVKTPYFYKLDVDVVIHPTALSTALEKMRADAKRVFMLPYNGVSFTINDPLRQKILDRFSVDQLPLIKPEDAYKFQQPEMVLKNAASTGLIHLFRTDQFKKFGGYNEEFQGWGYEDDEVIFRFSKLGYPPVYLEGYTAFHLAHPRPLVRQGQAQKNKLLAQLVKELPQDILLQYIKSWNRF